MTLTGRRFAARSGLDDVIAGEGADLNANYPLDSQLTAENKEKQKERTRSVAVVDRPTLEALEAVRDHKDRVCPTTCGPGTELRGTSCVAIPKPQERSRHASRPPERERDRSPRAQT